MSVRDDLMAVFVKHKMCPECGNKMKDMKGGRACPECGYKMSDEMMARMGENKANEMGGMGGMGGKAA